MSFSDSAFEKKLTELNNSQQSIQTLSLWLIHHRKHNQHIVKHWWRELNKAKPSRKLIFLYLANDVIQNSRRKGAEFTKEFATVLAKAFRHVKEYAVDDKTVTGLRRLADIWKDRGIYEGTFIDDLKKILKKSTAKTEVQISSSRKSSKNKSEPKSKTEPSPKKQRVEQKVEVTVSPVVDRVSPSILTQNPVDPPEPDELVKALQELEQSASSDAAVREKIASLPPEVSDTSLLEKLENKKEAQLLADQVEDACDLLNDYNGRLQAELEERKRVSRLLHQFNLANNQDLLQLETKVQEYESKMERVNQVRSEIRSHLQNLPDLTQLPDVTGGLAPLPSAGDLFNIR